MGFPSLPNCNWDMLLDDLYELLKEIKSGYDIDEDRVYLTGLSMGGHGTWVFAVQHPDEFAAIVPICGWLIDVNDARRLADMPVWVFLCSARSCLISVLPNESRTGQDNNKVGRLPGCLQ
ncbi:MAG TPA: hypothetical protein DCQ13_07360 [Firmicutes bacterium]|nr:hypothetical protein [Bacillota bacterium]